MDRWAVTATVTPAGDAVSFAFERGGWAAVVALPGAGDTAASDWGALLTPRGHAFAVYGEDGGCAAVRSDGRVLTFEAGGGGAPVVAPVEACRAAVEHVKRRMAAIRGRRVM